MANLVVLHIDKETGKIVARGGRVGPRFTSKGFLHEQLTPSALWPINHDCDSDLVIVQIYDITGNFILPERITIVDSDNVNVEFNVPIQGSAHITFFTTP